MIKGFPASLAGAAHLQQAVVVPPVAPLDGSARRHRLLPAPAPLRPDRADGVFAQLLQLVGLLRQAAAQRDVLRDVLNEEGVGGARQSSFVSHESAIHQSSIL